MYQPEHLLPQSPCSQSLTLRGCFVLVWVLLLSSLAVVVLSVRCLAVVVLSVQCLAVLAWALQLEWAYGVRMFFLAKRARHLGLGELLELLWHHLQLLGSLHFLPAHLCVART